MSATQAISLPFHPQVKDFVKRSFDIVFSLAALLLLSPLFGLIALAIRRDSDGPIFYRGKRIGKYEKPFEILKFRTMYEDPRSYSGPSVTAHDDPRITPLGRWLRDTKLNELPQFWNVLKGEMSVVGPRPEDPSLAKTWPTNVRKEILSVKPGITSPASVQYRNEESLLAYKIVLQKYLQELGPDKSRLDQLYVRYRSFWLDLDTILLTLLILIPKLGAYTPPESMLFVGPISRLANRYINWLIIDILVTILSMSVIGGIWRSFGPLDVGLYRSIGMTFLFAFLFSCIGVIFGVNRISWSKATFADAYNLLPDWILASCLVFIVNMWLRVFPPLFVVLSSALALSGFIFVRFRSRLVTALLIKVMRNRGQIEETCERVLVVGSGRTAEHTAWLLSHPAFSGRFRIIGFVDDDFLVRGMRIYGAKVIGSCNDIPCIVENNKISMVILAEHRMDLEEYCSITHQCDSMKVKVVVIPDIFGSLSTLIDDQNQDVLQTIVTTSIGYHCERCVAKASQDYNYSNVN
jgi:lipopolysaccharide/colanic/teichoic acid biosynthesis glycosyltransferase